MIANEPADLADGCYPSDTNRIQQPLTNPAAGPCSAAYAVGSDPRLEAGEPPAGNVLRCHSGP